MSFPAWETIVVVSSLAEREERRRSVGGTGQRGGGRRRRRSRGLATPFSFFFPRARPRSAAEWATRSAFAATRPHRPPLLLSSHPAPRSISPRIHPHSGASSRSFTRARGEIATGSGETGAETGRSPELSRPPPRPADATCLLSTRRRADPTVNRQPFLRALQTSPTLSPRFMASSLVSAPLQQSSQRSSPFPAYQAGPPLAASPPQPPPHAARPAASSAAAARADASPSIDSPRIEGPPGEASSSTRSGPSPAPARPVLASPTSTTTASGHASQGDSRELAVLAAKREKRRLRAVAKRERTRLAATVVDSGVPTPAPLSAVVQPPPAAVKAARTKAPAGTSVEVREVSRWSSSSSPAPPFDGLADGPAGASLCPAPSSSPLKPTC
jgi:hypothetical protein